LCPFCGREYHPVFTDVLTAYVVIFVAEIRSLCEAAGLRQVDALEHSGDAYRQKPGRLYPVAELDFHLLNLLVLFTAGKAARTASYSFIVLFLPFRFIDSTRQIVYHRLESLVIFIADKTHHGGTAGVI